ncbi:MAG: BA14K family protein [Bradyrhizobium sp.]|uniref:BA14K family protein n=1 Tax=Bradyrhizobium sp. TaxID=376 RepID=UPI0029AC9F3A|nr:BA14K family protein [Bradyrhizobium sp.]MDX3968933.1 BA14K family protein [Bradyrhizobium sp.]
MTLMKSVTLATALMAAVSSPVLAAPIAPAAVPQDAQVQQVQYRHWHGHPGHRWGGPRRHYYGSGAAVLGGLAAGAVIGGAIANSQAQANANAYCSQRYRSYDPASGTYLGYDGMRHPCP